MICGETIPSTTWAQANGPNRDGCPNKAKYIVRSKSGTEIAHPCGIHARGYRRFRDVTIEGIE